MSKKFLAVLLVWAFLAVSFGSALAANETLDDGLSYIDGKVESVGQENTKKLVDTFVRFCEEDTIGVFFADLSAEFKDRLTKKGFIEGKIVSAINILKNEGYVAATKTYIDSDREEDAKSTYKTSIRAAHQATFVAQNAPLKDLRGNIIADYGSAKSFLTRVKTLELNLKGINKPESGPSGLDIRYTTSTGKLSIVVKNQQDVLGELNKFLPDSAKDLAGGDLINLVQAINNMLAKLTTTEVVNFRAALDSLGFQVADYTPSSPDEPGTPSGPPEPSDEPEIVVPGESGKPIFVNVPGGLAEVKVTGGKAVARINDKTANEIIAQIQQAQQVAGERPTELVLDFSGTKNIGENLELNIPTGIIAATDKIDMPVVIRLDAVSVSLPVATFDLQGTKTLGLVINAMENHVALEGITKEKEMKEVGKAQNITLLLDGTPAKLNQSITLAFNIKGIVANVDKLGLYFVNGEKGVVEFVGGKVDKEQGVIRGRLPHLSTYVLMEYDKTFADVEGLWAKEYIDSMASKHIFNGKAEDVFAPADFTSRAEFAKIIVVALDLDLIKYQGGFEDVADDAWYADYVQTAFVNELVNGRVAGKIFDPNGNITRQEMMTVVGRALGETLKGDAGYLLRNYPDADKTADFAKEFTALLVEKQLVTGYPDSTLRPLVDISRAEAAKVIYGFYNY
ncbi:MAG: S-layer homology domain-containing protein [Bacillota bacterium]